MGMSNLAEMQPVRVGVVGLGKGYSHALAYHENSNSILCGLCDIDKEKVASTAEKLGAKYTFSDPYEFFRSGEIDAVSIATPNVSHHDLTLAALEEGLHVLCEKPLALNAYQATEMDQVAKASGKVLMVNYNYRFTPVSQALKSFTLENKLGKIYFARSVWHRSRGIPGLGGWFTSKNKSGGGPLIDLGVHRLDLALWFMNFPEIQSVNGATYGDLGKNYANKVKSSFDVEDLAVGFIRFKNGATLVLETSWALNRPESELMETYIYGTEAGLVQRNINNNYEFEGEFYSENSEGSFLVTKVKPGFRHQVSSQDEFLASIVERRDSSAPASQAVTAMRIIDGIYESAEKGREIYFD